MLKKVVVLYIFLMGITTHLSAEIINFDDANNGDVLAGGVITPSASTHGLTFSVLTNTSGENAQITFIDQGGDIPTNDIDILIGDEIDVNTTISHVSMKSENGEEFIINQFYLKVESWGQQTISVTSYRDGIQISNTSIDITLVPQTINTPNGDITIYIIDTLVDLTSNQDFENIDEIRLSSDTPANSFWYFDDIVITSAPVVYGVSSQMDDRVYDVGEHIFMHIDFNKSVAVTGTPLLELETGSVDRVAEYFDGNNTQQLIFRYIVQAGDSTSDLDYKSINALKLNGGSIHHLGVDANLTLAPPSTARSLAFFKDIVVDAVIPILSNTSESNITQTTATIKSQSNRDGRIHYVLTNSATQPTSEQVAIGQDHTGTKAFQYDSRIITANTLTAFDIATLTPSTTYYYYFVANGGSSQSVVAQGSFTTLDDNTSTNDHTPNDFSFTALVNQELNTQLSSNSIKITGIDNNTPISISGGEYQINNDGNWTSTSATIDNNDTIKVRISSSSSYSTTVSTSLTVGTMSRTFNITTKSTPPPSNSIPTISNLSDRVNTPDNQSIFPFSNVKLGDANGDQLSIELGLDNNQTGTLSDYSIANGNSATVQQLLRSISFMPMQNIAPLGEGNITTITLSINDGTDTLIRTIEVNATSINIAPQITSRLNDISMESNTTQTFSVNINDSDRDELNLSITTDSTNVAIIPNYQNPIVDADYRVNAFEFRLQAIKEGNATITLSIDDGNMVINKSFEVGVTQAFVEYKPENNESNTTEVTVENNETNLIEPEENNTSNGNESLIENNTTVENNSSTASDNEHNDENSTIPTTNTTDEKESNASRVEFDASLDVDITENDRFTKVTTTIDDKQVVVKVNKESDKVRVTTTDSSGKVTTFVVKLKGVQTYIDKDGNVIITLPQNQESYIKTRIGKNGKIIHRVTNRGKTTQIFAPSDSNTSVDENGTTTLHSDMNSSDGITYRAVIVTDKKGRTKTKFIKIDPVSQEEMALGNTLRNDGYFESGSTIQVIIVNGQMHIKTTTAINNDLVIE